MLCEFYIYTHFDRRLVLQNESVKIPCIFCYPKQAKFRRNVRLFRIVSYFEEFSLTEVGNPTYVGHTGNFVLEEAHTFLKTFHWVNRHGQTLFKLYFFYM